LALGKKPSNMTLRVLSALVMGPLFIVAIIFSKLLFCALMLLITIGMLYEWYNMTMSSTLHVLFGCIIVPISTISLAVVASGGENHWLLLVYFVTIWSVDSFAMIGGKNIGGPKLAPKISPKKTWSGLITGVAGAAAMVYLLSLIPGFSLQQVHCRSHLIIAVIFLALIEQMSDLFISYFKRKFAIKDSGTLIPGHGGVLDRFDGIILTAPLLLIYYELL
jgi:phosphatidate cytidylyltransferase